MTCPLGELSALADIDTENAMKITTTSLADRSRGNCEEKPMQSPLLIRDLMTNPRPAIR